MLLKVALEKKNILAVRDLAQHEHLSTTQRYVETHAVATMNKLTIRDVQNFIFVAATDGRDDLHRKFGLPIEVVEELRSAAKRANFGINCRDNLAGTAPASKVGTPCGDSEYCFFCRQSFVVEDEEVAAELWAFQGLILGQAARLQREVPERWAKLWAPALAYVAKGLSVMNAAIRARGKLLAAEIDLSDIQLD